MPALVVPEHRFDEDTLEANQIFLVRISYSVAFKMIKNAGVKQRFWSSLLKKHSVIQASKHAMISSYQKSNVWEKLLQSKLKNANVDKILIYHHHFLHRLYDSLDAYLIPKMGFRQSTKRVPITELVSSWRRRTFTQRLVKPSRE